MAKKYDFLVFIGRFQPLHNGHMKVIMKALEMAETVIILVGSSWEARSHRNPFSFHERRQMLLDTFRKVPHCRLGGDDLTEKSIGRIQIRPIMDHVYNDHQWLVEVGKTVDATIQEVYEEYRRDQRIGHKVFPGHEVDRETVVGLIGHSKDHTGYYLNNFPQWTTVEVPGYDEQRLLDATWIRELYFTERENSQVLELVLPAVVPHGTMDFLRKFREGTHADVVGNEYQWLLDEYDYIQEYRKPYLGLPHPVTFQTVDSVVVQSGHVLLVRRRARPGKGLLALPGGFLDRSETLKQGALRELIEETRIKVADPILHQLFKTARMEVFDAPHRSARGRVITNAFLIKLDGRPKLPKVKGESDAAHAGWYPIATLKPGMLFEDHYHIIQNMTAGL